MTAKNKLGIILGFCKYTVRFQEIHMKYDTKTSLSNSRHERLNINFYILVHKFFLNMETIKMTLSFNIVYPLKVEGKKKTCDF